MNTQFAKVGKTYPRTTLIIREDDPWTKSQTMHNQESKDSKIDTSVIAENLRLWKRL
ncbi:hypothetical protein [Flavobacterium algicola]|uniref:hypothetical protein n=1 Tax=Flavobacterium algicola TaxID=556529 RepID=UPI001EFED257|nr:hypothetical protein [Flavobacterium algicola]MCG9793228.1 hypothetical protein [Flavobacterium algicola]